MVVPICLPFLDPVEEDYKVNQTAKTLTVVAGWGATTERGQYHIQWSPLVRSTDVRCFRM